VTDHEGQIVTIHEHLEAAQDLIAQHDAVDNAAVNPYLPIAHALVALVRIERAKLRVLRREVRALEADHRALAAPERDGR